MAKNIGPLNSIKKPKEKETKAQSKIAPSNVSLSSAPEPTSKVIEKITANVVPVGIKSAASNTSTAAPAPTAAPVATTTATPTAAPTTTATAAPTNPLDWLKTQFGTKAQMPNGYKAWVTWFDANKAKMPAEVLDWYNKIPKKNASGLMTTINKIFPANYWTEANKMKNWGQIRSRIARGLPVNPEDYGLRGEHKFFRQENEIEQPSPVVTPTPAPAPAPATAPAPAPAPTPVPTSGSTSGSTLGSTPGSTSGSTSDATSPLSQVDFSYLYQPLPAPFYQPLPESYYQTLPAVDQTYQLPTYQYPTYEPLPQQQTQINIPQTYVDPMATYYASLGIYSPLDTQNFINQANASLASFYAKGGAVSPLKVMRKK